MQLDRRTLNRTLLRRQLLLEPARIGTGPALAHLFGLQSQNPLPPYVGLWSRLHDFDPDDLGRLILDRQAVRLALHRNTVHLVSTDDAVFLRPLLQPMLDRSFANGVYGRMVVDHDRAELVAAAQQLLSDGPLTPAALGAALAERWPVPDTTALCQAIRSWIPLVQVPPRGVWGRTGATRYDRLENWTGRELEPTQPPGPARTAALGQLITRYLRAFGPATVADVQKWSGLTRLKDVRPTLDLREYRDEQGRVLLDVPDGEIADGGQAAPVRLLAEFDNILLAHADRSRIFDDDHRTRFMTVNGIVAGTVLVDGFVHGVWRKADGGGIEIDLFSRVGRSERDALEQEARRLQDFTQPDLSRPRIRVAVG